MAYLKLFFQAASRLYLFPLYVVSGWLPRTDKTWVFGSWGGYRFADNAAAFFMYCQEKLGDEIRLVWISRDRSIIRKLRQDGYEAYHLWSPQGMIATVRAGLHIFDCFPKDANFWLSRGAKKVNLWSGVPLKVFERDIDVPSNRYYRLFHGPLPVRIIYGIMMPWHLVKPDFIIATSSELANITARAFAIPDERVHVTGFPRTDALISASTPSNDDAPAAPEYLQPAVDAGQLVFLYLPTFRDSNKSYMRLDWDKIGSVMKQLNGKFYLKTHPMDRLRNSISSSGVIELPQNIDIYDALPFTSVLISDYSSIIFDYMLLDKPIIYYTPDLAEFTSESRSLNFDPAEIAVGPLCTTVDQLIAELRKIPLTGSDLNRGRRKEVMSRIHAFQDSQSCNRVLAALQAQAFSPDLSAAIAPQSIPRSR